MFSLKGKIALVTGSAQGVGHGIIRILARAGASVVMQDLVEPDDLVTELATLASFDNEAVFLQGDVTDSATRHTLLEQCIENLGGLDILVNNAGSSFDHDWSDLSEKTIDRTLDLNVKAMLMMAQLAIDHFRSTGNGGSIVNVASVNSFMAERNSICYDISKGAVVMMTKTLAVETFKDHINVNALCPGIVDTPLFHKSVPDTADQRKIAEAIPCGRLCSSEECGYPVLYMVSEEGRYMTGQQIILDGGILSVQGTLIGQ